MIKFSKILKPIAEEIIRNAIQQIQDNDSVASGRLIDSFEYKIYPFMIEISSLEYGSYLDTGTKPRTSTGGPGFYEQIKEWVQYKGIDPNAAYPIYRSILKNGTKAHPWIFKMEQTLLDVDDKILREFSTIVDDQFTKKFEKVWQQKI